jgi:hypothetical protein
MNMPAPILTTTAALASVSIYSGTTTFAECHSFRCTPCQLAGGNRVGSAERFVNPNRVEMYHVNFGWQVIAPDAIVKTPPSVTSAVAALRGSPTLKLMRRARRARR